MRRALVLAGLAAGAFVLQAPVGHSGVPETGWACTYVEQGVAGAADNAVLIEASTFAELTVRRQGSRIEVLNANERPVECAGPRRPTMRNVDAITTEWGGDQAYGPNIDLSGGPFAPGATPEPDGSSEIEISVSGGREIGGFIRGSDDTDSVQLGTDSSGQVGVNLNAAEERSAPDTDLTMPPDGIFGAELLDGNDRLDASGGSLFPGDPANVELFVRSMGAGADKVIGSAQEGAIVGGDGRDRIRGGPGPERIGGGPGNDSILVRGGGKDSVECGAGKDSFSADGRDDIDHCEHRTSE